MLLGHWYLNSPTMKLDPLRRLIALMALCLAVRMLVSGAGLAGELAAGTIDSWLVQRMCGEHVTDLTNASRTMLFDTGKLDWLLKHEPTRSAILAGTPIERIVAGWREELELFRLRRKPFLLYE